MILSTLLEKCTATIIIKLLYAILQVIQSNLWNNHRIIGDSMGMK